MLPDSRCVPWGRQVRDIFRRSVEGVSVVIDEAVEGDERSLPVVELHAGGLVPSLEDGWQANEGLFACKHRCQVVRVSHVAFKLRYGI